MKANFSFLFVMVLLLYSGCSKENNIVETTSDPHPASILSYEFRNSAGIRIGFTGNDEAVESYYENAGFNISSFDTIWAKITILDRDGVNLCNLTLDNKDIKWGFSPAQDTTTIQFGFVPDAKLYKPNVLIKNKAVFRDLIGYEKNISFEVVYIPLAE